MSQTLELTTEDPSIIDAEFHIVLDELAVAPEEKASLEKSFAPFFIQARQWREQAEGITDPKLARVARLEIRKVRIEAEKVRKNLKEGIVRTGKAIDGANNILLAAIVPIEERLEEIEKKAEREEAERIAALAVERNAELAGHGFQAVGMTLGTMTDEHYATLLQQAKDAHSAKIEREAREEANSIAMAKAEEEDRQSVLAENARLKKEAEEREAEQIKAEAAAKAEREAVEAKAAAERAEAERARLAEVARVQKEKEAADAAARKERETLEEKARIEREEHARKLAAQQAEAKAAQDRADRLEAEAAAARKKEEEEAASKRKAEADRIAAEEASRKKALRAPDREKIEALAKQVRGIEIPTVKSEEAKALIGQIEEQFSKFAAWIETQAKKLS